ncbi:MAG TPA: sigma factor [Candidatus Polarisedimenticolia bacterium]|jgi:RNA polymerase sigma-70 factor (ECF subfamily)|nr:sigma factor [Candidatus Polarisedimenticolia bacterium]
MEDGSLSELQGLMVRLADGDRSAFPPVYARLWPVLRDLTARHLPAGDAEDAAQEALLRIFRRAAEFDPNRSALAWALGITRWEIRSARRRRWRRREEALTAGDNRRGADGDTEESLLERDMLRMMEETMGTLSPADRRTLELFRNGERAAVAAATFRKRVERALARLRAAWQVRHGRS